MEGTQVKIESSRSGHLIPSLNSIFLHSKYDPIKEANHFYQVNKHKIDSNNNFLILGLGFGYHVRKIIEVKEQRKEICNVLVVEPNQSIIKSFKQHFAVENFKLISGEINDLYQGQEFLSFLQKKPALISHPASFNLSESYFRALLTYNTPQTLEYALSSGLSQEAQKILSKHDQHESFTGIQRYITSKTSPLEPDEFLILAFAKLINGKSSNEENISH